MSALGQLQGETESLCFTATDTDRPFTIQSTRGTMRATQREEGCSLWNL